jgi:transcriptional regulator with XRE-family HTH domain
MAIAPGIEQIRRELVERGWSHQALADRIQHWAYRNGEGTLGVTRSYVSEWLTGKRGISAPYAHRLEGVLGIPADQFIDRRSARARELNDMKRRDFPARRRERGSGQHPRLSPGWTSGRSRDPLGRGARVAWNAGW